jgi:hypothetical protein
VAKEFRQRLGGGVLEIVHQDDALALLPQLPYHRVDHLLGLAHLEIERVDVGREDRDVALGKVAQQRRWVLEVRGAEERRDWSGDRRMQSTDLHLDLLLGLLDVAGARLLGQILVRAGMAADRVAGGGDLLGATPRARRSRRTWP